MGSAASKGREWAKRVSPFIKDHSKKYYAITKKGVRWCWDNFEANRILAFATVALVIIGYWTIVDLEDTLEHSERSWIGTTEAKLSSAPEPGKDIKVTVSVNNTGREPALDFVWDIDPFIVHKSDFSDIVSEKAMSTYVDACFLKKSRKRQQVVYPSNGAFGGGFTFSYTISGVLVDDAVVSGDDVILVRGCLIYRTFNKVRHSAFCFYYKGKTTEIDHLNICAGGSDAN